MKAVRLNEFGGVDKLLIEDVPEPTLRPHHVMIKVDSAGVNYADILRRGGNYPGPGLPSSMGLEAAGTVTAVGSEVSRISVGQKVMAMGPGSQAEYVGINGNLVFPYPDSLDPVEAGGMPIVFLTSYHILKSRGHTRPGDTVLVQAGASGVGTVLIQLAKAWGAKVIATASTQDKLDLCKSLGADITINYTATDFEEVVKEESKGEGVQLVAECVGGEVLEKSVRCLAAYGTLVSYGNASQTSANLVSSDITSNNRTVIGFSMGRSPVGTLDHQGALAEMFPMISEGKAKLIIDQILPLAEVGKAHQHLASRGAHGKVILTP